MRKFSDLEEQIIETKLIDTQGNQLAAKIRINVFGISIGIEDHSTKTLDDENGQVVFIDTQYGEPTVYIWDDINEENPTKISLEGAHISLRDEEGGDE